MTLSGNPELNTEKVLFQNREIDTDRLPSRFIQTNNPTNYINQMIIAPITRNPELRVCESWHIAIDVLLLLKFVG